MKARLPLLLSLTALIVAVFAPQPIGTAAVQAGSSVVKHALFADRARNARFARLAVHADRAGRAKRADFARNAGAVNTIRASRTPTPNMLLPLDANGKLPSSIGAVGPAGPAGPAGKTGPAGPAGPVGVSAEVLVTADSSTNSNTVKSRSVSCPSGKKVLGGGASVNTTSNSLAITRSSPSSDLTTWTAEAQETAAFAGNWKVTVYAVCANVAA
jgi:hypothetical protein